MPDNELRSLRIELGLPARDMVAVVQGLYPKYDKTMQSKCENGDDYGISLRPDAMKALYEKFAPGGTKASRRKKDRHRLTGPYHLPPGGRRYGGVATAHESRWICHRPGAHDRPGAPVSCRGGGSVNYDLPDHPVVQNLERTGYPDGKEPRCPRCPICGEECETVYKDRYGAYVGCDVCMETKDAWEVEDCFPERSEDA